MPPILLAVSCAEGSAPDGVVTVTSAVVNVAGSIAVLKCKSNWLAIGRAGPPFGEADNSAGAMITLERYTVPFEPLRLYESNGPPPKAVTWLAKLNPGALV